MCVTSINSIKRKKDQKIIKSNKYTKIIKNTLLQSYNLKTYHITACSVANISSLTAPRLQKEKKKHLINTDERISI